jgi:hypothetical protein
MKSATWVFRAAGVYGIAVLVPGLFMEADVARTAPPAVTHPEFYYGFFASALVWQLLFLLIASDPRRYRPLMVVAVLEKAAFFVPCVALAASGRLAIGNTFAGGMIDGGLMVVFAATWWRTRGEPTA